MQVMLYLLWLLYSSYKINNLLLIVEVCRTLPVVLKSHEVPFYPEVDSELIFVLKLPLSAANTNISMPCPKVE